MTAFNVFYYLILYALFTRFHSFSFHFFIIFLIDDCVCRFLNSYKDVIENNISTMIIIIISSSSSLIIYTKLNFFKHIYCSIFILFSTLLKICSLSLRILQLFFLCFLFLYFAAFFLHNFHLQLIFSSSFICYSFILTACNVFNYLILYVLFTSFPSFSSFFHHLSSFSSSFN